MGTRIDPLRELDRLFEGWNQTRPFGVPMDAYRHDDTIVVSLDLPGVDPGSIDLTVDRNVLAVSAQRYWQSVDGDQVIAAERRHGTFRRQILLGEGLDTEKMHASYENGVLTVTVPLAERAKPRRIAINTGETQREVIDA